VYFVQVFMDHVRDKKVVGVFVHFSCRCGGAETVWVGTGIFLNVTTSQTNMY
jgi:hypothetical protein